MCETSAAYFASSTFFYGASALMIALAVLGVLACVRGMINLFYE